MESLNSTTNLLPTFKVLSSNQLLVHIFATIFPTTFLIFDLLLLTATISAKRDSSIPLAYIVVMCLRGIISNFILALQYSMYLISTSEGYANFLGFVGKETTLLGTFSYLIALVVSVLMSVNRVAIVVKPMNEWFSHPKVFLYSTIIALVILVSLIIPYVGPCYVVFMVNRQSFVSGCAPSRHPITIFQNTYTIILPFTCMTVNLSVILHLRFVRNNSYTVFWHTIRGSMFSVNKLPRSSTILDVQARHTSQSTLFLKTRARRDFVMIRQAITIAVYLSIYEFGAFVIKIFPDLYTGLSQPGKEAYFYVRMESIPLMNFFIYFVETKKTRTVIHRFLWRGNKQDSNLVTVSHRTASGPHGNVVTVG